MNSYSPIIFFLGAGASVPAGLKTVVQLTDYFKVWLKDNNPNSNYYSIIEKIIEKIKDFKNNDINEASETKDNYKVDIETLLETVERLEDYNKDIISVFVNDSNLIFDED